MKRWAASRPVGGAVRRLGSSRGIAAGRGWRLAERTGQVLLLGAVTFWWGAVVVPRLVSLAFPELLPPSPILRHLNPDNEGTVANTVSAIALLTVAMLAFVNALQLFGRLRAHDIRRSKAVRLFDRLGSQDWIAAGGWTALAITATFLAWEEIAEFKLAAGVGDLGKRVLGVAYRGDFWTVLASPLIVMFVLAMGIFIGKGFPSTGSTGPAPSSSKRSRQASSGREIRALLILGLTAWVLVVVYEASAYFVFGEALMLARLLEETLEFSGTLVIGLSAAIALRAPAIPRPVRQDLRPSSGQAHGRQAQDAGRKFGGRGGLRPKVWSLAAVTSVVGIVALGVVGTAVHRAPLADARALTHVGAFQITLRDKHSLVQELGVLPAPPARLDLRIVNLDPQGRPGTMIWRVMEAAEGGSGRVLREGRMEVPAGEHSEWMSIGFPPLVEAEGRPLAVQLVTELGPGAHLRIGATKTNRYEDGRLWIRGALAWPDQNIEFVAHSAPELTRSKLRAMWSVFASDWRWPVLLANLVFGPTLVIFIPALLVTAALPRRGSPQQGLVR